ncbi:MAG: carbohydrate kinase family protein [Lautropia sp.]|nr:carbohydrate kinase family protein [Lautropia sp.]
MSRYALISGSVAFDTIMVFDGYFKDHILPERVHQINISMLTPQLKREAGGCAANIAYNLTLLGEHPAILGAVGTDGSAYVEQLKQYGIDTRQLLVLPDYFTPQAFVTTDKAANQITAFHPGAMSEAHRARIDAFPASDISWAIVSPNGKQAMQEHARQLAAANIPFIFDPGQALPMFSGEELKALLEQASALTVNDYEFGLLCNKTGWSEAEAASVAGIMIVTLGGDGSRLHKNGQISTIKAAPISQATDPTGCGDAYRAGLLYGLTHQWDWDKAAKLGSVLGAIKIESAGPQNHRPSRTDIADRFASAYGERPW